MLELAFVRCVVCVACSNAESTRLCASTTLLVTRPRDCLRQRSSTLSLSPRPLTRTSQIHSVRVATARQRQPECVIGSRLTATLVPPCQPRPPQVSLPLRRLVQQRLGLTIKCFSYRHNTRNYTMALQESRSRVLPTLWVSHRRFSSVPRRPCSPPPRPQDHVYRRQFAEIDRMLAPGMMCVASTALPLRRS